MHGREAVVEMRSNGAHPPKVIKVGGACLSGLEGLRQAGSTVARGFDGRCLVLVASALRGVTDLLERSLWAAAVERAAGGRQVARLVERLWHRHAEIAAGLAAEEEVWRHLRRLVDEVADLLSSVSGPGSLSRPTQARILSYGERLSAPLVALAVRRAGAEARSATAEEIGLRGTGPVRRGSCLLNASAAAVARAVSAAAGSVLVVAGFYGVGRDEEVILFGRGGSDYTAGALAALVDARELELWKDVDGFYSANPRRVPDARLVPQLTRAEAAALGLYGARILHPRCLDPLRNRATEIWIGRSGEEVRLGTRVVAGARECGGRVVALAVRAPRAVVRVRSAAFSNGAGWVAGLLEELGSQEVQLDEVGVSADSLCFSVVDEPPFEVSRLVETLDSRRAGRIAVRRSLPVIGIVGEDVGRNRHVRGVLDDVVAGLGASATAVESRQGGRVLQCRVAREALAPVLSGLHQAYFGATASAPSISRERA